MNQDAPKKSPGRWLPLLGLFVGFVALPVYAMRLMSGHLTTPWFVPIAAMTGAAIAAVALSRRITVWRVASLALLVALAAFEWWFILGFSVQPPYHGPVAVGEKTPQFAAVRADGSAFRPADFESDEDTVLVFFRGRW